MKSSILVLIVICVAVISVSLFYLNRHQAEPVPAMTDTAPVPAKEDAPPEKIAVAKVELPPIIKTNAEPSTPVAIPVADETKPDDSTNVIGKAVDALLSAKSGREKHELFQQLLQNGQLDQAIAELRQRAATDVSNPEISTTLGEALLNKVASIHDAGGDTDQMGILAMQADQSFNAALKIDPQNYEAQLVKSISMTYWPTDPTRDAETVQTLTSLIDRQETMASQPDFAQPYIYLGNEYQKIGELDKAQATWMLGLQKFPNDSELQKKVNGQ
ncbi:MAG TPA: hypothetical protein VHG89_07675 [Verrucomicrobiae bacterium]|nr:hypothetical protein [Verrucomicrobiae bacterium]